jgi:ectoine hydroxylase-related dioxygenase (phytanoyl-CoA dioxygenase family)
MREKQLKNFYLHNGYVVVKKVLTKEEINIVKKFSSEILSDFQKFTKIKFLNYKSWSSTKFTKKMMTFRKNYREVFSFFYDTVQANIYLKKIASKNTIIKNIERILDLSEKRISHSNAILRMDGPEDSRNTYDWHQERSYYPMNAEGNGIVVWIALVNINEKIGPLQAAIGSHKEGFLEPKIIKKKNFSTQKKVPRRFIKKFQNRIKSIKIKRRLNYVAVNKFRYFIRKKRVTRALE